MTAERIHAVVIEELKRVAPEIDPASLAPDAVLRDEVDMDSLDFLNFLDALHKRLGVDIPERDYGRLATLAGTEAYLESKLRAQPPS